MGYKKSCDSEFFFRVLQQSTNGFAKVASYTYPQVASAGSDSYNFVSVKLNEKAGA
jgi:hypothetical protein